ncbi:MAG: hypothetical protein Tsb0020_33860 [Haliangiales bacterium]
MRQIAWLLIPGFMLSACAAADELDRDDTAVVVNEQRVDDQLAADPLAQIELTAPTLFTSSRADEPQSIARLQRGSAFVEWVGSASTAPDDVMIVIGGSGNELPLIDMDTAEELSEVELFLALARPATPVPSRLLVRADEDDKRLLEDPRALDDLRTQVANRVSALHLRIEADRAALGDIETEAGSCSAGEMATSRAVFGYGYTPSQTCGDSVAGFPFSFRDHYYCNDPGGIADCDYALGTSDGAVCNLNNPCDHVVGTLKSQRARTNNWNGNFNYQASSYRMRGFAYNCQGDSGIQMRLRYGPGDWDLEIPVSQNQYSGVYVVGSTHLPARATAISYIQHGQWDTDISVGGPNYKEVQYNILSNSGVDDRGIFCLDAQKHLTMSPGNPNSCGHGPVAWCTGVCSGGGFCFE